MVHFQDNVHVVFLSFQKMPTSIFKFSFCNFVKHYLTIRIEDVVEIQLLFSTCCKNTFIIVDSELTLLFIKRTTRNKMWDNFP